MQDLKTMTIEELRQLATDIKVELENRIKDLKETKKEVEELCLGEYKFEFKTNCTWKNKGYVAKCYYKKGLQRSFYTLEETTGNGEIFIEDTFKAKERDILDIRYRNKDFGEDGFYIVLDGKLEKICLPGDLQNISTIKRFLRGEIIFENFLEIVGLKEIEEGVIDELLED